MIKIKLIIQEAISKILGMTMAGKIACTLATVAVVGGIAGGTVYLVNNNGDENNATVVENSDKNDIDDDIIAKDDDEDNSEDREDLGNEEEQIENENQDDSGKNETLDGTEDTTASYNNDSNSGNDKHNNSDSAGDETQQVPSNSGDQPQQPKQQPQQPQQPQQQPQQPKINVGIDDSISQQLRNIFLVNTRSYNGCKRNEFSNLTRQVALGQLSAESAKEKISAMRWNENANSVDPYYTNENRTVIAANVKMDKITVPNMSAEEISNTVHVNVSEYSEVFAYRNSDNTITVTTFACNFVLSTIN